MPHHEPDLLENPFFHNRHQMLQAALTFSCPYHLVPHSNVPPVSCLYPHLHVSYLFVHFSFSPFILLVTPLFFYPFLAFLLFFVVSPSLSLSSAPSTSIHFADIRLSNEDLFKAAQFDLILVWGENCILCCSCCSLSLFILTSPSLLYLCVCIILKTVIL